MVSFMALKLIEALDFFNGEVTGYTKALSASVPACVDMPKG